MLGRAMKQNRRENAERKKIVKLQLKLPYISFPVSVPLSFSCLNCRCWPLKTWPHFTSSSVTLNEYYNRAVKTSSTKNIFGSMYKINPDLPTYFIKGSPSIHTAPPGTGYSCSFTGISIFTGIRELIQVPALLL
uniref:Uncharacterized protein n=2 Tax=Micrurus TaxID=8634 RepID=A0A2D4PZK1_MICSU